MGEKQLSSSTCLQKALYQISHVLELHRKLQESKQSVQKEGHPFSPLRRVIKSILECCMSGEAPHCNRNRDQTDNMLQEETSRKPQDFHWKGKLWEDCESSLDFVAVLTWETDMTHHMCLPEEGGHSRDRDFSSSKARVTKLCCKLESPRELLNIPLSRWHPKSIKSESLTVGLRHPYF